MFEPPFGTDAPCNVYSLILCSEIQFQFNIWKSFSEIRIKRHFPIFYRLMAPALRNCRRGRRCRSLFRFMLCKESKRNLPTECKLIGESHESPMPTTENGDGQLGLSRPVKQKASANNSGATICKSNVEIREFPNENSRVATTPTLTQLREWLFIKQEHIGFETTYNIRIIDFHST